MIETTYHQQADGTWRYVMSNGSWTLNQTSAPGVGGPMLTREAAEARAAAQALEAQAPTPAEDLSAQLAAAEAETAALQAQALEAEARQAALAAQIAANG